MRELGGVAVLVSLAGLGALAISGRELVLGMPPNYCEMTYMRPSYSRIPMDSGYGLYLYREGAPSAQPAQPAGYPVLFIPGNAGSYQQVRSLATTAATGVRENGQVRMWCRVFLHGKADKNALCVGEACRQRSRLLHDRFQRGDVRVSWEFDAASDGVRACLCKVEP
jgi:hypothetical protein